MAAPVVDSVGTYTGDNLSNPHSANYPATGVDAGDLLINLGCCDGTGDTATTAGAPLFTSNNVQGHGSYAEYETADGDEGGTTYTVTITSGEELAAFSICISGWDGTAPEVSSISNNSSTTPNAVSMTPSWSADTLYITVCTWNGDAGGVSTWPSGYTANQNEAQYSTVNGCAFATKTGDGSAEDAGAWALTNSVGWQAFTIAVKAPAAGNPHYYYAQL